MIIKDFPCKNCTRREVGCHGSCVEYKTAKANYEKEKENERAEEAAARFIADSVKKLSNIQKTNHFRRNYIDY